MILQGKRHASALIQPVHRLDPAALPLRRDVPGSREGTYLPRRSPACEEPQPVHRREHAGAKPRAAAAHDGSGGGGASGFAEPTMQVQDESDVHPTPGLPPTCTSNIDGGTRRKARMILMLYIQRVTSKGTRSVAPSVEDRPSPLGARGVRKGG
jgi:hypothetical protein